jgi:hypothetical protein
MRAALRGSAELVTALINAGAIVNDVDIVSLH